MIKKNVYFCSQNLMKFHPHFDEIIAKILRKDKKAKILFIKDKSEILSKKIIDRFKKNSLIDFDRINFLGKMSVEEYINLCGSSSVLLDTLYFGAFLVLNVLFTPNMPTENLKSRIVLGAYKQMQIENPPIVNSNYVEMLVELK